MIEHSLVSGLVLSNGIHQGVARVRVLQEQGTHADRQGAHVEDERQNHNDRKTDDCTSVQEAVETRLGPMILLLQIVHDLEVPRNQQNCDIYY